MNITEPSIMAIRIAAADPGETLVYKGDKPLQAIRARGLRDVTIIGDTHPIRFVGEQTTFRDCHNLRIVNASFRYFGPGNSITRIAREMFIGQLRNGRALVLHDCHKVTLENCDMGWATDDTVSIHGQCSDITLQSCLVHGGQGPNTKGLLAAAEDGGPVAADPYVTLRDCVFAGVQSRGPRIYGWQLIERCIFAEQTDPAEPGGYMALHRVTFAPRARMISRPVEMPLFGGRVDYGGCTIIEKQVIKGKLVFVRLPDRTPVCGLGGRGRTDLQNPAIGEYMRMPQLTPKEELDIIDYAGTIQADDAVMFARQRARAALGLA